MVFALCAVSYYVESAAKDTVFFIYLFRELHIIFNEIDRPTMDFSVALVHFYHDG